MNNNNNTAGRRKGSSNKVNKQTSNNIKEWAIEKVEKSSKYFHLLTDEKKVSEIRKQVEFIMKYGSKQLREEVADAIFVKFKPHYTKLDIYFSRIQSEKQFEEGRKFMSFLKPEHVEEVGELLASKRKKKDR